MTRLRRARRRLLPWCAQIALAVPFEFEDVLPIALDILLLGPGVLCRADPVGEVLLHQIHPGAHAGLIVVEATGAHAGGAALLRVANLLDGGEAGPQAGR